jgi:hypothetical protein
MLKIMRKKSSEAVQIENWKLKTLNCGLQLRAKVTWHEESGLALE